MTRSQIAGRIVIAIFGLVAIIYAADYLVLRIRMRHATAAMPFESLTRARLLAIPMKSGSTQYELDEVNPTETLTCVHSLFPHYGDQPCWYLKPRLNKPIPIS